MNKVTLMGRLVRDVELKKTGSGKTVGTVSLATNEIWKDGTGEKKERVDFHSLVFWGVQADVVAKYAKKGSQLLVEGKIQTRSWKDDDGRTNYRTEIIVKEFELLGSKPAETAKERMQKEEDLPVINVEEEINTEDIPF
ncbi:MAG: single-stranded DNA-binding protein [Candidatus Komeilibacteria bacterium]|nr:single-stranded DNA-binding protein [Candidatus Komeilibacteria bacterium]